ncbi:MAG: hypothetical protein ACKPCM_12990 [Pseudanabaena sp.]
MSTEVNFVGLGQFVKKYLRVGRSRSESVNVTGCDRSRISMLAT